MGGICSRVKSSSLAVTSDDDVPVAQGVVELDLEPAKLKTHNMPKIHWVSLVTTLFFWITFAFFCNIASDVGWEKVDDALGYDKSTFVNNDQDDFWRLRIVSIVLLVSASIYFCWAGLVPEEAGILSDIRGGGDSEESALLAMRSMCASPPVIRYEMECFHFEESENLTNEYEKVVSWRGSIDLEFTESADNSAPLPSLSNDLNDNLSVLLLTIKTRYFAADRKTKAHLVKQKNEFRKANKSRDIKYKTKETLILDGDVSHLAVVPEDENRPWWFSVAAYRLSVLLGLVFVYRMFVEVYVYDRATWVCEKVISIHPIDTGGNLHANKAEAVTNVKDIQISSNKFNYDKI